MKFISESIFSQYIHSLTDIKLKQNDPIKTCFDNIQWMPIHDKCFHLYSDIGAPDYTILIIFLCISVGWIEERNPT